jgi:hypothetical protein
MQTKLKPTRNGMQDPKMQNEICAACPILPAFILAQHIATTNWPGHEVENQ